MTIVNDGLITKSFPVMGGLFSIVWTTFDSLNPMTIPCLVIDL